MLYTRRYLIEAVAGAAGAWLVFQDAPPMPTPRVRTPVNPPEPAEKEDKQAPETMTRRVSLRAQEKQLRDTMNELFLKVRDLKIKLDQTPTAKVFSVAVFKETQEIEKLAKRLKSCART